MNPEEIKKIQIQKMKIPPPMDRFHLDLGLYLLYHERYLPGVALALVDCEFMGLAEIHETDLGLIVLARFEREQDEDIICKGYLLTSLFGDELYAKLPEKGEAMDIEITIDPDYCHVNLESISIHPMQGRYKEQFLPLRVLSFLG